MTLRGEDTLYFYNTVDNFKLIAIRRSKGEIDMISYSKDLKKILAGGQYIEMWDPKSFKLILKARDGTHTPVCYIQYIPSYDVIVAKEESWVYVYDRNLRYLRE